MKWIRRLLILAMLLAAAGLIAGYTLLVAPPPTICPAPGPTVLAGNWTQAPDMPTARSEIAATVLDGRIYVGGGIRLTGATPAFEAYDLAANHWQRLAGLPAALHHFGMAATGGRIYISGGYRGNDFASPINNAWEYDPAADAWSALPAIPQGRAAHAMVAVDNRLIVVGGVGPASSSVWIYDPAGRTWQTGTAPIPTLREHLAATVLDGRVYVAGGRWEGRGNMAALERYDPAAGAWESLSAMPTARGGLAAATVNGRIHVAGGEDFYRSPSCTFNQHEAYDPATDSWSILSPMPTPRHGLTSVAVDGRWYVIGGGTKAAAQTLFSATALVETFTP